MRIPLTLGEYAIIDNEDFPLVSKHVWHAIESHGMKYAQTEIRFPDGSRTTVCMHILIAGKREGSIVDHRDRNGLNNQRGNLRHATRSQNQWNSKKRTGSSRFKGVHWEKSRQKWTATIMVNRKKIHLGRFHDEEEAARVRDEAAQRFHGEFCYVNFGTNIGKVGEGGEDA